MYARVRKTKPLKSNGLRESGQEKHVYGHRNNKLASNHGQRQYIFNGRGEIIKTIYHS